MSSPRGCESVWRPGATVLELSANPFDRFSTLPCLLIRPASHAGKPENFDGLKQSLSRGFARQIPDARITGRDVPGGFSGGESLINFAISGPEQAATRRVADKLIERLRGQKTPIELGVAAETGMSSRLSAEIDRAKAAELGVTVDEALAAFREAQGRSQKVGEFKLLGRSVPIVIETSRPPHESIEDAVARIKLRARDGTMVPLSAIAAGKAESAPATIERLNLYPMLEISGNLPSEAKATEVRALCETLAEQVRKELALSDAYRLTWLK